MVANAGYTSKSAAVKSAGTRPNVSAVALHARIVTAYSTPNTASSSMLPPSCIGARPRSASAACGKAGARRSAGRRPPVGGSRRGSPRCRALSPSASRAPRARRRRMPRRRERQRPCASGRRRAVVATPKSGPTSGKRGTDPAEPRTLEHREPRIDSVCTGSKRQTEVRLLERRVLARENRRLFDAPSTKRLGCAAAGVLPESEGAQAIPQSCVDRIPAVAHTSVEREVIDHERRIEADPARRRGTLDTHRPCGPGCPSPHSSRAPRTA